MTDLDLDRLEALAKAATPGPWVHGGMGYVEDVPNNPEDRFDVMPRTIARTEESNADAAFIAQTGPDTTLELIRELREARKELAVVRESLNVFGTIIEQQCADVLNATGAHDLIDADGDGDWMSVWERMHELCQKGKAANE